MITKEASREENSKKWGFRWANKGDCIDCFQCVKVCPTDWHPQWHTNGMCWLHRLHWYLRQNDGGHLQTQRLGSLCFREWNFGKQSSALPAGWNFILWCWCYFQVYSPAAAEPQKDIDGTIIPRKGLIYQERGYRQPVQSFQYKSDQ